jgi:hypothetical protein
LVFEKNANFFAENCQKLQKIVIITSTPDEIVKKIAQNVSLSIILPKILRDVIRGKRSRTKFGLFMLLKKLPKVNYRQFWSPCSSTNRIFSTLRIKQTCIDSLRYSKHRLGH